MKALLTIVIFVMLFAASPSFAQRIRYSGSHHTHSHGGHYAVSVWPSFLRAVKIAKSSSLTPIMYLLTVRASSPLPFINPLLAFQFFGFIFFFKEISALFPYTVTLAYKGTLPLVSALALFVQNRIEKLLEFFIK